MSTPEERVERGAALLDEKRPGWWQVINLDWLDIRSACNCIAGQLGNYSQVLVSLGLTSGNAYADEDIAHGFEAADFDDLPLMEARRATAEDYDALTAAWRDLILRRREAAGAPS